MSTQEAREAAAAAEALGALSWCLRAVAQGWSLDPRERDACLSLLAAGIPGTDAADLAMTQKILAASRRLGSRQRDRAASLSVRFREAAESFRH